MGLERTYNMEAPPIAAMNSADYERIVVSAWGSFLNSPVSPTEREVQQFLEVHPALLPGAFNITGNADSGHSPWFNGVISQPPLPSYSKRVPDFMWLSTN